MKNKKNCVICGKPFDCPPSSKKVTCSRACWSERARRATLARGGGDLLNTPTAQERRISAIAEWRSQNPDEAASIIQQATDAAMALPEGHRGPQNRQAKVWHLISPDGERIDVINLTDWARINYALFEPESSDPEASAGRVRAGFAVLSRALAGKLPPRQSGLSQYKGWGLASPSEKKGAAKMKNIYATAVTEAVNYTDKDAFVSDVALSTVWNDTADAEIPTARLEWLGNIWDATHRSFSDVLEASGMTRPQFRDHFMIPYRTVQGWDLGDRTPPAWLLLLMQETLGLVKREP